MEKRMAIDQTPKADVIFKVLFGDQKHHRILIHLLNSVLKPKDPITHVEIKQTELSPEYIAQKGVRLDILATTSTGEIINVEMQKKDEHNIKNRTLYHWSKLFCGQLIAGDNYQQLCRTICINILNFKDFDDEDFWHIEDICDRKTHKQFTDLFELHFLEIPKIRRKQKKDIVQDPIMFWLEFIDNPKSEKIQDMIKKELVYQEAKDVYEKIIADPQVQELLRVKEKAELDYNSALSYAENKGKTEGLAEGKKVGEKKAKIESAKRFLSMGLSIEQVASGTGLSIEEVEGLKS